VSGDEEPLGRPFLDRSPTADEPGLPEDDQDVRPYLLTGGRTHATAALSLESLVRTTALGREARATFESALVLDACDEIQSVAEVAALLRVPVGVARVLVGDLAAEGLLEVCAVPHQRDLGADPAFLERLIHGVAAL
jgi:Protein of unknown function (DUF742)